MPHAMCDWPGGVHQFPEIFRLYSAVRMSIAQNPKYGTEQA